MISIIMNKQEVEISLPCETQALPKKCMRRGSREFWCERQLDFGYDISQKNTQGNAVKAFRISEAPFFEPSAMYNNNQTLLDVYDIRAKEKIKKLKFTIDKHIHLCQNIFTPRDYGWFELSFQKTACIYYIMS